MWIQEAVASGRYTPSVHMRERLMERKLDMEDVFHVVDTAAACRSYDRVADHAGTCWRVTGPTVDGEMVAIGVEAYLDKKRRRCILCTIFRHGE